MYDGLWYSPLKTALVVRRRAGHVSGEIRMVMQRAHRGQRQAQRESLYDLASPHDKGTLTSPRRRASCTRGLSSKISARRISPASEHLFHRERA